MYTIQREIGRLEGFKIGLVGDLANGRTVRSLAYVLSMYKDVKMYFVAPDVVSGLSSSAALCLALLPGREAGWEGEAVGKRGFCCRGCHPQCGLRAVPALPCLVLLQCRMKDDIKSYLTGVGVDWEEVDDLAQVPWGAGVEGVMQFWGAGG